MREGRAPSGVFVFVARLSISFACEFGQHLIYGFSYVCVCLKVSFAATCWTSIDYLLGRHFYHLVCVCLCMCLNASLAATCTCTCMFLNEGLVYVMCTVVI